MIENLYSVPSTRTNSNPSLLARPLVSRILRSILLAIAVTLALTGLELGALALTNVFHWFGRGAVPVSQTVMDHILLLILIACAEFLIIAVVLFFIDRPLDILAYLRATQAALEAYCRAYTPLLSLNDVYETPVTGYLHNGGSTVEERQTTVRELVQWQGVDLFLLGGTGTGKTTALRAYQYRIVQSARSVVRRRQRIPIYIPLQEYSLFLEVHQQAHLLDFLRESDLEGLHRLRPYLKKLMDQGRLTLLCDGFNDVDPELQAMVANELVLLMLETRNLVIVACREEDYDRQPDFSMLVENGQAAMDVVAPLGLLEMRTFIEEYIEQSSQERRATATQAGVHPTAGQIRQAIEHSLLRDHCTNPMLLFLTLEIIGRHGLEYARQLTTRGQLLRTSIIQCIERTQLSSRWNQQEPDTQDVLRFLAEIAFLARRADGGAALQLPIHAGVFARSIDPAHASEALRAWLADHTPSDLFIEPLAEVFERNESTRLLEFSTSAVLIHLSSRGILGFRHEFIAQALMAHYLLLADAQNHDAPLPVDAEMLRNAEHWHEPIALWAGLVDRPLHLAERFALLGKSNPVSLIPALVFSLTCLAVAVGVPQIDTQQSRVAPTRATLDVLVPVLRESDSQAELAYLFMLCNQEQLLYRSLLPLLSIEGINEFLRLLDLPVVVELLFTHLETIIDSPGYEKRVNRLILVLGRLGAVSIAHATELSRSIPGRSIRLRSAAIHILGETHHPSAVDPLIARLSDPEPFIVERAVDALGRLGPEHSLERLIQELENRTPTVYTGQVHRSVLLILAHFLDEHNSGQQMTASQRKRLIQALIDVLTLAYAAEPDIQQQATALLVHQGRSAGSDPHDTSSLVIAQLIPFLASGDDILVKHLEAIFQEIGSPATPPLLEELNKQPSEILRMRIVEVLRLLRDPEALEALLGLMNDPSRIVQKQVSGALQAYDADSIPGLIQMVLTSKSEQTAERAAQVLIEMGEKVIQPVLDALLPVVPGRTYFLVQVLDQVGDARAIPDLITLLGVSVPLASMLSSEEALLGTAIIMALGHFVDPQVVPPLVAVLTNPTPQIHEEAITALSELGPIAVPGLIAELDVEQESPATARVRRALLIMNPFPGEALIDALASAVERGDGHPGEGLTWQILTTFRTQGAEAAHILVKHLFHDNLAVRAYIRQTLAELPGPVVVPVLLEALNQPDWVPVLTAFLLKYPESLSPLVNLLGDPERSDVAATILIQAGSDAFRPLIAGLDDPRAEVRALARTIIVTLVRQQPRELPNVVGLFHPPLPRQAHETLLEVLTEDLADLSIPDLLEGLADAHLLLSVMEALLRLAQQPEKEPVVLRGLLNALRIEELRRGAMTALVQAGEPAVKGVGDLITDKDEAVAKAAKEILGEMGAVAFPFIWAAHSDNSNPHRRKAALEVFYNMQTEVIKDELVIHLSSDKPSDLAMALVLLLERVRFEVKRPYEEREMVPLLLDYVQQNAGERTSLRILSLLLLLGGDEITVHMLEALYHHPGNQGQLLYAFLLMGGEAEMSLLEVINDPTVSPQVRAEVMSIIGMLAPYPEISEYAQSLSRHPLVPKRTTTSPLYSDELAIALRALGGLLAGGHWNVARLQELRRASQPGSPEYELFHILLGGLFGPEIARLEDELQHERDARNLLMQEYAARLMASQQEINALEEELEQSQRAHDTRVGEVDQLSQEQRDLFDRLERAGEESNSLRTQLNQAMQEREGYRDLYERISAEKSNLESQIQYLRRQISQLGSSEK